MNSLTLLIRSAGFSVDLFADLPAGTAGRIYYSKRHIDICASSAHGALMTLCHEAGHMVDYNRRGRNHYGRTNARREQLAYIYGWAIIRRFGYPISKAMWRDYHED